MNPSKAIRSCTYIVVLLTLLYQSAIGQCPSQTWDAANSGSAYVAELGNKAVYGSFYNQSQAQYVNDGRVYFFGDVTNDGFIGDGFGYEYIKACDDSTTTVITGRGGTEFNILDVNNRAGVSLRQEMKIKTNLSFAAGTITTDRTRFGHRVFFQEGATHNAASNNKHINGRISRLGMGVFAFPTGDGDHMSRIIIDAPNESALYTAAYYSQLMEADQFAAEGLFDRNSTDFDVLAVQTKEHWTLRGADPTTITLSFTNYSDIDSLTANITEDLTVVGFDGRKWVDLGKTKITEAFGSGTITSATVVPNRFRAFTFGVLDTDGDKYADGLDVDPRDPCVPDPTLEICTERVCVEVEARVYLEGALMTRGIGRYGEKMRAELNTYGYLPGQTPSTLLGKAYPTGQPYLMAPWDHSGGEGSDYNYSSSQHSHYDLDAVDWVLVSLRTGTDIGTTVCTKAGLLYEDGEVVMTEPFDCCNSNDTEYYIVIEHRNHLPVMTPTPMPVVDGKVIFDFTQSQSYTRLLGNGQKLVNGDRYVMYAGNGDQVTAAESPKDINSNDISLWAKDNGQHSGYYLQDYDLNGDVNVHDKALWLMNNGIFTDVDR